MRHDFPLISNFVLKYTKSRRDIIDDGRSGMFARPRHSLPRQLHAIQLLILKALFIGYREVVINNRTRPSFDEILRFEIN